MIEEEIKKYNNDLKKFVEVDYKREIAYVVDEKCNQYILRLPKALLRALEMAMNELYDFSVIFVYYDNRLYKVSERSIEKIETPLDLYLSVICTQHLCPSKHGVDYIIYERDGKIVDEIFFEDKWCIKLFGWDECRRTLRRLYPMCPWLK